ncbi:MAG: MCE family protein [Geodermatophilaceae bacterium]|nr:MCE family protein [Geodermatophilaceae bacterium]
MGAESARRRPSRRLAALIAVAGLLLTACGGFRGAYSLSLPGGADLGDNPYSVVIEFEDVLDLVPQSAVRVADVPVGRVDAIELSGWVAKVTILVNSDVVLPGNAEAAIRQSSLLGEKFVELSAPSIEAPSGRLSDGGTIPIEATQRNIEVEEVLGALSLLLNGGGVAQLQTITHELGLALQGREEALRNTLTQLDGFIGGLDQQKSDIIAALESIDRLAETLAGQRDTIAVALDTIGPGLDVLEAQRTSLVDMLDSLARLGDVGTRVIDASRDNTIADLRALQPILTELAAAGSDLPDSLDLLFTYPFPRQALNGICIPGPSDGLTRCGDYQNMVATLNLDLATLLENLTGPSGSPSLPPSPEIPGGPTLPTAPTLPPAPTSTLPGLPCLPGLCAGVSR